MTSARFASRDHFAAYNGTAPIEVSSGRRKIYRLSRRGNRRLNHAIHMAAVTQIRHRHSPGRAYYDRKIAEGHSGKEAIRALKRRISDAIYARLRDDATRTTGLNSTGPGGHSRNDTETCAAGSHPEHRLFGQATPEPATTLRPTAQPGSPHEAETQPRHDPKEPLDKQRGLDRSGPAWLDGGPRRAVDNNRCVRTSPARAWATIRFAQLLELEQGGPR